MIKSFQSILSGARHPLTVVGAILTTGSAITMIGFWLLEVAQLRSVHPYAGIILFLILPVVFVLGLVLMPLGVWLERRKRRLEGAPAEEPRTINLGDPRLRRALTWFAGGTFLNVLILSVASYKGVEHMDSNDFCGLSCHTVMEPEYTTFQGSPHARVGCSGCHIGEGASWFVRSKLSGTRQILAVTFGTYSRPIPSPVKHLRPARETCEGCHWPQKFEGDKFVVRTRFEADEANTPLTTVLLLKVGGHRHDGVVGIHGRHLDAKRPVHYMSIDGRREVIPKVSQVDEQGKAVEYVSSEIAATPEQLAAGEMRVMDCVDCHNRPTHVFDLPERAVDRALNDRRISRELPFVKKKAVELLRAEYPDKATASLRIAEGLAAFYKSEHPDVYTKQRASIEVAATEVQAIYARNIFPEMRVGWGVHPNHIGHEDFQGCFRCHDDNHKTADGRVISQDCETCHTILAQDEADPKVLADLGLR